jgi:hypothetical protein
VRQSSISLSITSKKKKRERSELVFVLSLKGGDMGVDKIIDKILIVAGQGKKELPIYGNLPSTALEELKNRGYNVIIPDNDFRQLNGIHYIIKW